MFMVNIGRQGKYSSIIEYVIGIQQNTNIFFYYYNIAHKFCISSIIIYCLMDHTYIVVQIKQPEHTLSTCFIDINKIKFVSEPKKSYSISKSSLYF